MPDRLSLFLGSKISRNEVLPKQYQIHSTQKVGLEFNMIKHATDLCFIQLNQEQNMDP